MKKGILFLTTSLLFFTACTSSVKGKPYPDQVRINFINSCSGKLPAEYKSNCECMLKNIEQQYSLTEYIQIEKDIKAGKDVSAFLAFTDSVRNICFPQLKNK
jgi:hypothetical protein